MKRDPIPAVASQLISSGYCTQADLDAVSDDIDKLLSEAIAEADAAPYPEASALLEDVYAE